MRYKFCPSVLGEFCMFNYCACAQVADDYLPYFEGTASDDCDYPAYANPLYEWGIVSDGDWLS